jgi:hypothetical protein
MFLIAEHVRELTPKRAFNERFSQIFEQILDLSGRFAARHELVDDLRIELGCLSVCFFGHGFFSFI